MVDILHTSFQKHFFYIKYSQFDSNLIKVCPKGPCDNKPSLVQAILEPLLTKFHDAI